MQSGTVSQRNNLLLVKFLTPPPEKKIVVVLPVSLMAFHVKQKRMILRKLINKLRFLKHKNRYKYDMKKREKDIMGF